MTRAVLRYLLVGALLSACQSKPEPQSPSRAEPEDPASEAVYENESLRDGTDSTEADSKPDAPKKKASEPGGGFAPPPPAAPPPARAPSPAEPQPSRVEVRDDEALEADVLAELGALQRDSLVALQNALSSGAPDCERAALHRDRICDLAERICRLTEELPDSLEGKCADGNARCERARHDYSRSCK